MAQTWRDKLCPTRHGECLQRGGLGHRENGRVAAGGKLTLDMLARNSHNGAPSAIISPSNETKDVHESSNRREHCGDSHGVFPLLRQRPKHGFKHGHYYD